MLFQHAARQLVLLVNNCTCTTQVAVCSYYTSFCSKSVSACVLTCRPLELALEKRTAEKEAALAELQAAAGINAARQVQVKKHTSHAEWHLQHVVASMAQGILYLLQVFQADCCIDGKQSTGLHCPGGRSALHTKNSPYVESVLAQLIRTDKLQQGSTKSRLYTAASKAETSIIAKTDSC